MKHAFVLFLAITATAAAQETAPRHEIGLTLGGIFGSQRTGGPTRLDEGAGTALQANYGYRLLGGKTAALYGEVHFLANPLRGITSTDPTLTKDSASLYVTPGIRVKFFPAGRIAPYVAIGGGWSLYEQSTTLFNGKPNPAPRHVSHGAFDYGAGVDVKVWRFVGLRGEVRDFYAGAPAFNTLAIRGGQHNVVAGGGLVLRFR